MVLSRAPEIEVETVGTDVTYRLPARNWRWIGGMLILSGILYFPLADLLTSILKLTHASRPVLEVLVVVLSAAHIALGLLAIFGRCQVEWRDGQLAVLEYAGAIRLRRRLPLEPIRAFIVNTVPEHENRSPADRASPRFGQLRVEFEHGQVRTLVLGYPRNCLQALADDLSARVGETAPKPPPVEVPEPPSLVGLWADLDEQPSYSRVKVERRSNGILLEIPRLGTRKGARATLRITIILGAALGFFIFRSLRDVDYTFPEMPRTLVLLLGTFGLFWAGLILRGVNMSRLSGTVSVENGCLTVTQRGLFGTKRRQWRLNDIAAIRADTCGTEPDNVAAVELQIFSTRGKQAGFFAGRGVEELRWLATELRRTTGVPASRRPAAPNAPRSSGTLAHR